MREDFMGDLSGKVALVTGGSRGIGRAIAHTLAREGALVAVNYAKNADAAAETVKSIEAAGGQAFVVQADVSQVADIARLVGEVCAKSPSGKLDILVNNAGGTPGGPDMTPDQIFDAMIAANLKSAFFASQIAVGQMNDGGRIILISSNTTIKAYPGYGMYVAAKSGLNGLAISWAQEYGPRGITVNAVAPALTETDLTSGLLQMPGMREASAAQVALGRVGQPQDIAEVVAFLCSPKGGWITGQLIDASGGTRL
jgi:3-oxoacyl-[acyl-carrier protein] reductase